MAKYYYRFKAYTKVGKKFRAFWNECIKADEAAEKYAAKVGAAAYYSVPSAFAGGVTCVSFDKKPDTQLWRSIGPDQDGIEQWEPRCQRREGVIIAPNAGFRPSSTAVRLYDKKASKWENVIGGQTMKQWAQVAGILLTGDKEKDEERVNAALKDKVFWKYIEFYGDQVSPRRGKQPMMPKSLKDAILLERKRLELPVVSIDALYRILEAETNTLSKDEKMKVVEDTTPTFFEWKGYFYLGIDYECKNSTLETVPPATYTSMMLDMKEVQRCLQRAAEDGIS